MQGNYRHHYSGASAKPAAQQVSSAANQVTQVSMVADRDCKGLPTSTLKQPRFTATNYVPPRSGTSNNSNRQESPAQSLSSRQRSSSNGIGAHYPGSMPTNSNLSNAFYWPASNDRNSARKQTSNSIQTISSNNNSSHWTNTAQHPIGGLQQQRNQSQSNQRPADGKSSPSRTCGEDDSRWRVSPPSDSSADVQVSNNNYASQLRNNQLQYRFQQQQAQMHRAGGSDDKPATNVASSSPPNRPSLVEGRTSSSQVVSGGRTIEESRALHVNFNRASRAAGNQKGDADEDDAEEGGNRKKKYLTAKYGQQQMNLIKKRLKIEMWLYEQLKELTKDSKSQADLDEIDIDLDQLLDMEDNSTRRHWLRRTLEPFEDVESARISEFIDQVLEQSRLL